MLENQNNIKCLYFDMHEIIAIKRNIYAKAIYIDNVKALDLIEPRIKKAK